LNEISIRNSTLYNMLHLQLNKSLIQHIDEACDKFADRDCFVFGEKKYTYKEIQDASCQVANQLIENGFQKEMRGAVFSLNDPLAFIALLGIIRAGGIWVPVNPRNSLADNITLLKKFGCDALFFQDIFTKNIKKLKTELTDLQSIVCLNAPSELAPTLNNWIGEASITPPNIPTMPTDIVCIPMTGGTTGLPKAVALSNRNMVALMENIVELMGMKDRIAKWLLVAPMTHVGGRLCLVAMHGGGTNVLMPKMGYDIILDLVERERITDMFLPPTAIYKLMEEPNIRTRDFSSLEYLGVGSSPMSVQKLKEAIDIFGPVLANGYGQTEAPTSISQMRREYYFKDGKRGGELVADEKMKSVGRPTPISEIEIMDQNAQLLPAGKKGEIVVKGPFVSEGYFLNPEATAQMRKNGWHYTGDIGYKDEDGLLYIVDRKKDMIITGGFNVYTVEVEGAISTIPEVSEVACFGIPDEKWGEAVHACIILNKNLEISPEAIMAIAKQKLGSVKAPKSIAFVDDFPRNSNGKVLKRKMRNKYWEGHEQKI